MKARETELAYVYLFFDLIILNLSIVFMAWYSLDISLRNYHDISIYLFHGNLSWIITYFIFRKKNLFLRDSFLNRIIRISKRTLFFLVCLSVLAFLLMPQWYSRNFLIEYTVLFYVGKLVFYYFLYTYLKINRQNGRNINRVVIFGVNDISRLLRKIIDSNYLLGYRFVGYVSNASNDDPDVIGHSDNLDSLIDQHQVQMVFVAMSIFSEGTKEYEVLKICNQKGIRLRFIPENQRWYKSRLNMESVGGLLLINPQEIPLDDLGSRVLKRLFDLLFSSFVILFVLSWSLPFIAFLIKLSSKGPVFFVQKRTGFNNKTFTCLKFRSMQVNGDADKKQATTNDHRTTRIGQFLRRTNIDELPQFFNVFMGQMSVVGPRPHMLKHTEEYSKLIKHYLIRHYVKPGVTGWAQVSGWRGETDELWKMEERVKYDMIYIENWTFGWDIAIIWQTLFGSEAYKNAG